MPRHRCGHCGRRGHNRRTCPQLEIVVPSDDEEVIATPNPYPPVEYNSAGELVVDMTQRPPEIPYEELVRPRGVDPTYVDRVIAGCTTHGQFYNRMIELDRDPTIAEELVWSRIKIDHLRMRVEQKSRESMNHYRQSVELRDSLMRMNAMMMRQQRVEPQRPTKTPMPQHISKQLYKGEDCMICLSPTTEENFTLSQCGHTYCKGCYEDERLTKCGECRSENI